MQFKTKLTQTSNLIDLTPLVDVVFLLLIFFIITSDILPLKSLHIENPRLDHDSAPLTTQILVVMDAQNVIYVGSKKSIVELASLKLCLLDEIAKIRKQFPGANPTVVLSVDRRVEYGSFLQLFSTARECKMRLRLVYQQSDNPRVEKL